MADGPARRRRGATSTSNFGVSKRESHDASAFYSRFTAPELSTDEDVWPDKAIDRIVCGDARQMDAVHDRSVALVVTSPPYYAGKAYEESLGQGHIPGTYVEYLQMLRDVFAECVRTLEPGGRIAVNVANLGRKPYRSLSADVTTILQDDLRLLLRGEVIWVKQRGASGNCAWGSFRRPSNPSLRDLTERVVIASKGRFDRAIPQKKREKLGLPHRADINGDEFMDATLDLGELPPESATRIGHPAPFPVSLPERLIELNTYEGDLVLDPFMGSGSSAVAAVRTGRHYVGYDTDAAYVAAADARVAAAIGAVRPRPGGSSAPGSPVGPATADPIPSTRDAAEALLAAAGCEIVARKVTVAPGLVVPYRVRTASGRELLIDLAGAATTSRPGMQRADVAWRTAGRAAVAHAAAPDTPFVVVTPAGPVDRSIAALVGPGRPIEAIVELGGHGRGSDQDPFR